MNILEECWEWNGSRSYRGNYGVKGVGTTPYRTHRLAWAWVNWNGEGNWQDVLKSIPKGLYVCHRCDNPPCVNPNHLFLGTSTDNNVDTVQKKRHCNTKRTHCKRGHAFAEHGAVKFRTLNGRRREQRFCLICRELWYATTLARNRAKIPPRNIWTPGSRGKVPRWYKAELLHSEGTK